MCLIREISIFAEMIMAHETPPSPVAQDKQTPSMQPKDLNAPPKERRRNPFNAIEVALKASRPNVTVVYIWRQ